MSCSFTVQVENLMDPVVWYVYAWLVDFSFQVNRSQRVFIVGWRIIVASFRSLDLLGWPGFLRRHHPGRFVGLPDLL